MMMIMPTMVSRRTNQAPQTRMIMVTGMAATVSANSASMLVEDTKTRNWTVKPRKKKKSNFKRAI